MAKQYDFSDFDEPKESSQSNYDFSDFDTPAEEAKALPELGRAEAAVTSFGQGSSLGLAPIASGIVGAGANAVEQLGDALGLSTDSELQSHGFTLPEKKSGLEGLMEAYYDSRDRQKAAQEAAHEQYPVQSIAANVVGSIPTTIASGGATGALSKVLPQADKFTKATTLGQKALAGAREGVKAGALVGLGEGDAKLLEGEIGDTARETLDSAVGGGVLGGGLPILGGTLKGASKIVSELPIAKQISTAFKGGKAGIKLDEDSAGNAIKTYSEDLLSEIQSQFRKAGMTKANAMDYADEIGVRVNAGEKFQDVMDEIVQRGASSKEDLAEKMKLYQSLKSLKDGAPDKMQDKLDLNAAKMQQKMEQKGYNLLDSETQAGNVSDYIPGTNNPKPLNLTAQNYQKIAEEGGEKVVESPIVQKLIQQAGDELPIDINKYDLNNLSLRELEDVLGEVNRHTGDLSGPAKTNAERTARSLAADLRRLSEDALQDTGTASGNASMSKTFAALDRAGIKDNVLTNNQVRKDQMVDDLRNTVTAGNPIDRQRMFQYLEEASPEYKNLGFKDTAEFLNDFNDLAKQVKPLNSTNAIGLLGSAKNIGLTAANKAGSGYEKLTQLVDTPVQQLEQIAQKMGMSQNKAAQQFSSPLLKAAQADDRKRSAILYGLYQQPAFREAYQSIGEGLNDTILPVGTDENNN